MDEFDPATLRDVYAGCGSEAYPPELLLKGVLLELLDGRRSPAQWCRNFRENSAVRWAAMGLQPARSTLYDFRDRSGKVIDELNEQLIHKAQAEGFVSGEQTVQDGTSVRACASRHRLLHMETLQRRLSALETAIEQDMAEEAVEPAGQWMAQTPGGRVEQGERYRQAEEILAERLAQNAKRPADKRLPDKQVVVSTSDPEAAMGRDKEKVFGPLYTAQCVTDLDSLLVAAYDVAARPTDAGTLAPLLDRTRDVLGAFPKRHLVDAGYVSILDLKDCDARGVELIGPFQENDLTARKRAQKPSAMLAKDMFVWLPDKATYVCPEGHELQLRCRHAVERSDGRKLIQSQFRCSPVHCQACPQASACCQNLSTGRTIKRLEGEEFLDEHRRRMDTPHAQDLRRKRGSIIERIFGDLKAHRNLRRLHGRGLRRAHTEIGLAVLAYNLQRLHSLRQNKRNSNLDTT